MKTFLRPFLFVALAFLFGVPPIRAEILSVGPIGLTVENLDLESRFFTEVLHFERMPAKHIDSNANDTLLGLTNTRVSAVELKLGSERILLTEHLECKGRAMPSDSRSFDHWFQHIAIVVSDMEKAYQHLRAHKVKHVSTGPQSLPDWNKDAGGIKAFYFRDPENHVLEIIWFPPGKGDPRWQAPTEKLFLGIDHTAIVVSDTERSLEFYRDQLGFKVAGSAENYGVEQEHLNQVFGARLRITALRARSGPGIEFLEYITPPGGRPLPSDAQSSDLTFWVTHLHTARFDDLTASLRESRARFVSSGVANLSATERAVIVRDPDGHAVQLIAAGAGNLTSQ